MGLTGNAGGGAGLGNLRWTVADLGIDRLQVGTVRLAGGSTWIWNRAPRPPDVRVKAQELAGRLSIPHKARAQPLRVELERLDLRPLLGADPPKTPARPAESKELPKWADPRQAPALDLAVDRLHWADNDLGRLTLRAAAAQWGLAIEELRADRLPPYQADGDGHLDPGGRRALNTPGPGCQLRRVVGELLRHLDYASYLEQAPGGVLARLSWPGGPPT